MLLKTWDLNRRKDGLKLDYTEDLSHLSKEIQQLHQISPVKVVGLAQAVGGIYTLKGTVSTELTLQCSRCLTNFSYDLKNQFDEVYIPNDIEMNWDHKENVEEDNVHYLDSDEIDITKIVEEAVLIQIPMVPICKEDCKGLCSNCGNNLNQTSCDCKTEVIDPRLAALSKWFKKNDTTE